MKKEKEKLDLFQIDGHEVIIKTVTDAKTSGKIYLPVSWIGKKVKVVRIE